MKNNEATLKRTLFIDFETYAENDPEFKDELIDLIIDNLRELQEAYNYSVKQNDPEYFGKACHKVKTTLSMLADKELDIVVEELKNPGIGESRVSFFHNINAGIIASLLEEKRTQLGRTGTI